MKKVSEICAGTIAIAVIVAIFTWFMVLPVIGFLYSIGAL